MKPNLFRNAITAFFIFLFCSFLSQAQVPISPGGTGAPAGSGLNGANNAGGHAIGLGCGGGGGSWWGGTGGDGKFGGGGGGAGGYFSLPPINWAGGEGGQGVVVIAYYNGASFVSSVVLIAGTSVTVGAGITSAKVWAIGGGGGGGGATEDDGTSGGSGGAGGVAYITKAVTNGNIISYSIGAGGLAGHGTIAATAGGTTSVTIAGTTIYGNGGQPGIINNTSTPSGGTFSGGDGGATGGTGYGKTGDDGGGGGGAIGSVNGTQAGNDGGTGANAADVSGLFAACAAATNPTIPTITSFTPTAGLSGTSVVITGTGFTGATAVKIGGIAATSFTVNSATQITAVVSGSTVTGSVIVTLPFVTISKPIYFFTAPVAPFIDNFTPTSAKAGELVTINGTKFLGVTTVSFGGTNANSFTVVSDYQIVASVGEGTTGDVNVTSSSGTGTANGFTWTATTQSSSLVFTTVQETQMTIGWTNGNASNRVVFVKQGAGAITNPTNNITYTASSNWASKGTQAGVSGYYCVYNGTSNSVTLSNLTGGTTYTVQVFEYSGNAGAEVYYTATAANNPKTQTTLSTLPLSWLSFTVTQKDAGIQLNWTTSTELNTQDFIIQHSSNLVEWKNIGVVASAGNASSSTNYQYTHYFTNSGTQYYRILQRDLDGKISYSKVVRIIISAEQVQILSNPVNNGTVLLELKQASYVQIFNSKGQRLIHQYLQSGSQTIDVTGFAKGMYLLKAGTVTTKIIIQ